MRVFLPKGPSTRDFRFLVPKTVQGMHIVALGPSGYVGILKNQGPYHRPQYIRILIIKVPKRGP